MTNSTKLNKSCFSDEIQYIKLYKPRLLLLHLYIAPFIPTYAIIFYYLKDRLYEVLFSTEYDSILEAIMYKEGFELVLICLAVLLCLHLLLALSCVWSVHIRCMSTCYETSTAETATKVKVVPTTNNGSTELIPLNHSKLGVSFEFQKIRYIFNPDSKKFDELRFPITNNIRVYRTSNGLDSREASVNSKIYDKNIMDIVLPEFFQLFFERATAPFFIFQVFCVLLWCLDEYWGYALFTLIMLIALECVVVFQQKRNLSLIKEMNQKSSAVYVYRDLKWISIQSDKLLPGDIISVHASRDSLIASCDLLLVHGTCVVDEAMLSGESIPQAKESIQDRNDDELLDIQKDGKINIIFGGTKILQTEGPQKGATILKPPSNGAICYVLRTGFSTSQGKLLRTILFSVKRVTANNLEALLFLLFLLLFAIAAAVYVWTYGSIVPNRSKYKLLLQCTFILTSVVPPELPIILSLAVNNSLVRLLKLRIFCTEPFRIPNAGKLDICCFDKTGTLTMTDIEFLGVTNTDSSQLLQPKDASLETQLVIGFCHALTSLQGNKIIGDPLEIAAFSSTDWTLGRENKPQAPRKLKGAQYQTIKKFQFNSTLKRMTVVCSSNEKHISLTKGAPEVMKDLLVSIPPNFDEIHNTLVARGARVLVLAYKIFPPNGNVSSKMERESAETDMILCGFICFSTSIKPGTKQSIEALHNAAHEIVMITGDNPYTACYVAREVSICSHENSLIYTQDERKGGWYWQTLDRSKNIHGTSLDKIKQLKASYNLCVTGDGLVYLSNTLKNFSWIPYVNIFARMSPKQKEQVILSLNTKFYTLMCGDGTNDVAALKHAHVGVSLLSSPLNSSLPEKSMSIFQLAKLNRAERQNQMLQQSMDSDAPPPVKLGDASIASPFTARSASIDSVCELVKQGRCTLVTVLQMYKIIAINALISAYSQSVLYLEGFKFSNSQALLQGMMVAFCFMLFSRNHPLDKLSKAKPLANVFNAYTLTTIFLQFLIHFGCLYVLMNTAKIFSTVSDTPVDLEADFEANIFNTTIFLLSLCMQINACVVNYSGRPYIASIFENKGLLLCVSMGYLSLFSLSLGFPSEFCELMEIVILPSELRNTLVSILFVNIFGTLCVETVLVNLIGRGSKKL